MSQSGISIAMRKLFRQPSFLVAAGILLASALTLNAATQFMKLNFRKEAVKLRTELDTIPAIVGPWKQVSKDEPLDPETEFVLGTSKYIFRTYADSRIIPAASIAQFENKTFKERQELIVALTQQYPSAMLAVTVEYYTGMVDTVAHIPDRCYVAGGFEPTRHDTVRWSAFANRENRSPESSGDACFITFEDQTGARSKVACNVSYFFHVNGEYASDPLGVRLRLQNLRQKYGYYSKIEMMNQVKDPEAAGAVMNDFLGYLLPEVEKCLPDWKAVMSAQAK